MTAAAKKKGVPAGTETEAWRKMSARVAWLFWLAKRRAEFLPNEEVEAEAWKLASADFRANTRMALRNLVKEGLFLDSNVKGTQIEAGTEDWTQASARVAWMMWLVRRRSRSAANEQEEATRWETEAPDFRKITRAALELMEREGIVLSS